MHAVGDNPDGIAEYNLSIAWNVSTAVYSTFLSTSAKIWIQWNGDGSKLYTSIDSIVVWDCSIAYRIASCSGSADSFDPAEFVTLQSFAFADSGDRLYIGSDAVGGTSYSYTLSTPYLVSSASVDKSTVLGHRGAGFFVEPNGSRLWSGDYDNEVNEHSMSPPFDLSTQSFTDSITFSYQYARSNHFNSDGSILLVLDGAGAIIHQYELAPPPIPPSPANIIVTLNSPENDSYTSSSIISFNASYVPSFSNKTNATYHIYNLTGIFNKTVVTLTAASNTSILNVSGFTIGTYNWNVYACAINVTDTVCAWGEDGNYCL